jgi:hypothetical protein
MVLSVLTSAAGASARRRTVLRQPRSHGSASSEKGLSSLPWPQCCSFAGCSARTRGRPPRPLGSACVRSSRTATCWSPPASTVRSLLAGWLPDESNGCPCGCVRARAVAPSLDGVSPRPAGWARCAALRCRHRARVGPRERAGLGSLQGPHSPGKRCSNRASRSAHSLRETAAGAHYI